MDYNGAYSRAFQLRCGRCGVSYIMNVSMNGETVTTFKFPKECENDVLVVRGATIERLSDSLGQWLIVTRGVEAFCDLVLDLGRRVWLCGNCVSYCTHVFDPEFQLSNPS